MTEPVAAIKTKLRGIFLTSENPAFVARFYQEVAGLRFEELGDGDSRYWKSDETGIQLAIHDDKKFSDYTHPADSKSNLTHLYFKIADLAAFQDHLKKLGVNVYCADGVVVTVIDPDGRKVMFGTA